MTPLFPLSLQERDGVRGRSLSMLKRVTLLASVAVLLVACATSNIFPPIGNNLGNPLTFAVNSATARLYVNNSNDKDLYNQGSIQVYNIATPAAPVLVGTQATLSFSGEMYLDTVNQFLYTPNRYGSGASSNINNLLQVNVNEASASFLEVGTTGEGNSTPFGAACCDPSARILVPTLAGTLDAFAIGASAPVLTSYNLTTTANDGTIYTNPAVSSLAIIGTQAFVTMPANNVLVVNLTKLGTSGSPVDYVITNVISPRGIATDGTLVYLLATQTVSGATVPQLLILNPATLTALVGNTQATNVDVATIQQAALTMGLGTTTTDPEQVVVGTTYVFITNTGDDLVTVVNRAAQTVNTNITVGDQPFGMGLYSPAGADTALYVANQLDNSISIINATTLAVSATFTGP